MTEERDLRSKLVKENVARIIKELSESKEASEEPKALEQEEPDKNLYYSSDSVEEKPVTTPGISTRREIFEQVEGNHFLVWDRIEEKFIVNSKDVWHSYAVDGVKYLPLLRLPWPSVTVIAFTVNEEQLFNELRQFFIEHLDVQNELFYDVYACFVMASWRCEDFKVVPYLFFIGPLSSGKTRALECLQRLCYRGILAASMSAASLFRALEAWHPTIFLDETEIYNRKEMVEVLALLNSGYRKGQYAIRIEKIEEGTPQIAMFDTFGFKILAGTEELASTLQSRCIITPMSRAVRQINLFINEEKAQDLRNSLLYYRFKNLGKNVDCDVSEFNRENGYFHNARVIELFISLIQVAPTPEVKQRLIKCMRQITQSRLDEEQASIEARIFEAVLKCEEKVETGKISTQAITEAFNEGISEKEQLKSYQVGRKVRALGFEKCRFSGGKSGFYWDKTLIERLKARYEPSILKTTSLTSQTSQTSLSMEKVEIEEPKTSEVSEDNSSETSEPEPKKSMKSEVSEQSEVSEGNSREHKSVLLVKRTKNAQKCYYCELVASEFEVDDNGSKYFVCESDLKEVVIPAYKRQNYEIKFVSEVEQR
jgi:hypothetical protein